MLTYEMAEMRLRRVGRVTDQTDINMLLLGLVDRMKDAQERLEAAEERIRELEAGNKSAADDSSGSSKGRKRGRPAKAATPVPTGDE